MASKKSRKRSKPVEKKSLLDRSGVKIGIVLLAIIVIVAIATIYINSGSDGDGDQNGNTPVNGDGDGDQNGNTPVGNPVAVIDTSMGTIKVELFEDLVPNTVENFVKLANDGFFDGLVFHRVINDFMIQGGGFETDGSKKESPYGTIDLEINEEVRHVDGAIAMARTSDPNSATSQFFINDGAQPSLEPGGVDQYGYAAFGVTIEGIDVVQAIAALDPEHTTTKNGMANWPEDDVIINSITIENQ